MTFPSATSPQTPGSSQPASQQGWSHSSNKPLSHRLMPADDKSPPPPPSERVGPTVCLIKPKGGRQNGSHSETERQDAMVREGKKIVFLSCLPFLHHSCSALPSIKHNSAASTSLPLFLIFLLSLHLCLFSASAEKCFNSISLPLSVSSPAPTSQSTANSQMKELKTEVRLLFGLFL